MGSNDTGTRTRIQQNRASCRLRPVGLSSHTAYRQPKREGSQMKEEKTLGTEGLLPACQVHRLRESG